MRGFLRWPAALAALAAALPAAAFTVVPMDGAGRYVVAIEAGVSDHVPLSSLPPPYDRLGGPAWSGGDLWFGWNYFRSPEHGRAVLVFDEDERATATFEFSGERLADGDTVAAAMVLVDRQGAPIRTLYAAARVAGDRFEGGGWLYRATAPVARPAGGWEAVAGFTFLTMKYYAIQNLDAEGVAQAMRRAAARVTGGAGEEEWAQAPD